ncbi:MAG: hypothetical protein E7442_07790 [Ruminococcaceae bacterium]|nr:hypothetical protein [Oscillospiraceae bacterium]
MKRFSLLIFTITMLSLILLLGSCAPVVPTTVGGGIIVQEASAAVLPMSASTQEGHDSTAFLVGEFRGSNGSIARFNGFGEITLIAVDGSTSTGSYSLTEYDKKPAVVVIEFPGAYCEYTFALNGGSGDFTLTDAAGSSYDFSPVQY